ncbi:MAG: ATP-binding cassette domain-containing protein, partial [Lachnospiraceae bacterium]|nr:ATP-binding cassette domain-containing protein [Lachnospiraceae bacterium]
MEILGIKDLTFTYRGAKAPTIKDVSFSLNAGEVLLLCGATGSGKSTLLRMLKRELTPLGEMSGTVLYKGKNIHNEEDPRLATKIGFVAQRPEGQIVTDKVWHELAFGLENMGVKKDVMARRIAEIANYFGIEKWFDRDVADLSGGEKQLLNLAGVMVMDPEVLILDEPTAQLDPIAASDFLATVRKLNADLSLSVIICEHRLEEIVPYADKLLAIDKGQVLAFDSPKAAFAKTSACEAIMKNMPAASLVYERLTAEYKDTLNPEKTEVPFEIREGREFLQNGFTGPYTKIEEKEPDKKGTPVLKTSDLRFRYDRNEPDILKGLNLTLFENEILCLLGGNGSGKTTALKAAAGLLKPY